MNIQIKDSVGFSELDTIKLVRSLFETRKPEDGNFNFGLETHGVFGITLGVDIRHPIQVWQSNKRKSNKSPIVITIKKHTPIL